MPRSPRAASAPNPPRPTRRFRRWCWSRASSSSPDEFGAIILRANPDGSTVRLRDVARIEVGGLSYQFNTRLNGKPTAGLSVLLSPTGNALATASAVEAKMKELSRFFPANIAYDIPYNITPVVKASIEKVLTTLVEAIVLVFIVMFLFLQNIRYTIIPTIVVPVALLGTCAMPAGRGLFDQHADHVRHGAGGRHPGRRRHRRGRERRAHHGRGGPAAEGSHPQGDVADHRAPSSASRWC